MNEFDLDKEAATKVLERYRKILYYMGANMPISALCLPKKLENTLLRAGFERAYDFIDSDLKAVPGLGERGLEIIAARLNDLFSISL